MSGVLKEFGQTAQRLSRNPLGIIALFIVLVYGFAALVLGTSSDDLDASLAAPLVWFLVLFPVLVLGTFAWLVSRHHTKLYSPSDFKRDEHFLLALRPSLSRLEFAAPMAVPTEIARPSDGPSVRTAIEPSRRVPAALHEIAHNMLDSDTGEPSVAQREEYRVGIYEKNRGVFLVHALQPSELPDQEYDVFIYLARHEQNDFGDVERTEFFLGHRWGNKVFGGKKEGGLIGIRTSAYGTFLCTCRVIFADGHVAVLHRYIDFEMGEALRKELI